MKIENIEGEGTDKVIALLYSLRRLNEARSNICSVNMDRITDGDIRLCIGGDRLDIDIAGLGITNTIVNAACNAIDGRIAAIKEQLKEI